MKKIFFLIFIALSGCIHEKVKIEGFNEHDWKTDVCGCGNLRSKYKNIISNTTYEDYSKEDIIYTFGSPNKDKGDVIWYFSGRGVQCSKLFRNNPSSWDTLDAPKIIFRFKNEKKCRVELW